MNWKLEFHFNKGKYIDTVEWAEEHTNHYNHNRCTLYKFKEKDVQDNKGYTYSIVLMGQDSLEWTLKHYKNYTGVYQSKHYEYMSNSMDVLLEIIHELKKTIS